MSRILLPSGLLVLILLSGCSEAGIKRRAARIHEKVWTVDTHTDTPLQIYRHNVDLGQRGDIKIDGGQVDFIRMREGGLDAAFFAAFIAQGDRTPAGNSRARARAMDIIQSIYQAVGQHPELAAMAYSTSVIDQLEWEGKRAIYIGIENGYAVGSDLTNIQSFYELGARYLTLCHTKNNDICDSSTDTTEHGGLSDFGREVVREMNRLGMIVDVSHASDQAFYDILEISSAPVIASHSCARAVRDNPRNLDDDMLRALAKNGGVVQMCILSYYVKDIVQTPERDSVNVVLKQKWGSYDDRSDEQKRLARIDFDQLDKDYPEILATVSDAVDHIDHIVKIVGIDHVGIGTDFDGGGGLADCNDASQLGNITLELLRRGYSQEDIGKIWGGNFRRVFAAVETIAAKQN
ncbi:MAG: dipeptidase [Candidatus Neomarinimicrobiota bacterium]